MDEVPLDTVFPISGIGYGEKATVSIPALWSSNLVGPHIVRAIIDSNA